MTLFLGIFVALVVINALLLIFSTTLRVSSRAGKKPSRVSLPKSGAVSFKVPKSELKEAG